MALLLIRIRKPVGYIIRATFTQDRMKYIAGDVSAYSVTKVIYEY
jgi:hypothetical protein